MTIGQKSLVLAIASAVAFLAVISYKIVDLYHVRQNSVKTQDSIEALSILNKAIIELSLERSVMQVTLNLDAPIQPAFKNLLETQRQKSDAGFAEAVALVANKQSFSRKTEFVSALEQSQRTINDIRDRADRALIQPTAERDPKQVTQLPLAMKDSIITVAGLPKKLTPEDAKVPTFVANLKEIQTNAWEIREFGGRERTHLAIATATGRPFDDVTLQEMKADHAIAQNAMSDLQILAGYTGLKDNMRRGIDQIAKTYFGTYATTRSSILNAASSQSPYPVPFEAFFEESSSALQTAVDLSYLSGDEMVRHMEGIRQSATTELLVFGGLLAFVLAMCGYQIYFTQVRVSKRILHLAAQMQRLTEGHTDVHLEALKLNDEIGRMAESVEVFRQNGIKAQQLEDDAQARERRTDAERNELLNSLADNFEQTLGSSLLTIEQQTAELHRTADGLNERSNTSGSRSFAVADAAQNTSESVQTVAQGGTELSSTIGEVAGRISETTRSMNTVVAEVQDATQRIESLKSASEQIGNVVALITEIAGQTNLLALNATIEAARAGDAGKGFAIVASEVKTLSSQTENATSQIDAEIRAIQAQTERAVDSIKRIERSIQEVDLVIAAIAAAVEQQAAVTSQIAGNMDMISNDADQVTTDISYVCQSAAGSSGAAIKVLWSVSDLSDARRELEEGSREFLAALRAGSKAA